MGNYRPDLLPSSYVNIPYKDRIKSAEETKDYYQVEYDGNISPHYLHTNGPFKLITHTPVNTRLDPNDNKTWPPKMDNRWCIGDNKEAWEEKMRKYYPNGKLRGWKYADPHRITYNLNSEGYRCPEWDDIVWEETWCVLGCSLTFGVGLAEDELVSHYLQKYLGDPVINLGVGGGSNELIELIIARQINNLPTPKGFIVLYTSEDRGLVYHRRGVIHNGPWAIPNKLTPKDIIRQDEHGQDYVTEPNSNTNQTWHYLCNYENRYNSQTKLYDIHQRIRAMTKGTYLFEGSWFQDSARATYCHNMHKIIMDNQESRARDLWHPGSEIMDISAKQISDIIINNIIDKE